MPNLRMPVVAGQFYPADARALRRDLERYVGVREPRPVLGGLCPHAGYMYSGATAGALFAAMDVPATVFLLGPKHQAGGADYAVWAAGAWRTPLGDAPVDEEAAAALLAACPLLVADQEAHRQEHSLEVIVPFVQYANPAAAIVPVAVAPLPPRELRALGEGLAAAVAPRRQRTLVVVSSDMTHYEAAASAARKDELALERLRALDAEGLVAVVHEHRITMCGVWPAAAALVAFRALGAAGGSVVKYTNSGETSGDFHQVVGYAAVTFA